MRSWVLVLDIDGTTLRSDHTVSPRLRRALARALADGHIPVVATGRRRKTARAIARFLGIGEAPLVACDGAVAFASMTDALPFHRRPLGEEVLRAAAEAAADTASGLILYTADDIYATDFRWARLLKNVLRHGLRHRLAGLRVLFQDVRHRPRAVSIAEAANLGAAVKGLFRLAFPGGEAQDPEATLRERLGPFVDFTMPPGRGQEFVAKGVSKAEGVAAVLRRLGKGWGDVVAFGDNWNDLSVLRRARVGFVMGNAPAGLPREGLALAPTCDEDGVAVVLERLERAVSDPAAVAGWSGAGDHPQELVHRLGGAGGQQLR